GSSRRIRRHAPQNCPEIRDSICQVKLPRLTRRGMDASVVGARHASALARAAETAWPRGKVIALEPLAGDASARRYVRVRLAGDAPASAIAMLLPHDEPATKSEEITTGEAPSELPFVDVHRYLARHGVPVMAIYHVDERDGVLLLEDLGDLPL